MKKILGLDLGSASIGWAMISEDESNNRLDTKILGMGVRIIPYEGTEGRDFETGTGESKNAIRTRARTIRKGYDRYQMRRKYLVDVLKDHGMMPGDDLKKLPKMALWELRSNAVNSKVSLQALGRLLLWLNQKRGYKSSRSDFAKDKKDTDYVAEVKTRHEKIKELNLTIGQYFFKELQNDEYFRVKENVFPREAYIEEFDAICSKQQQYHPELKDELLNKIRNEIIYYQRPLKSQKGLVSVCEFEGFWTIKDDKEYFVGPKVVPKSSPLFQLAKLWENINNLKISSRNGENIPLTLEQKRAIFNHLDNNEKLTQTDLMRILNVKKNDFVINKQIAKGIQGNITKIEIRKCLEDSDKYDHLMQLKVNIINREGEGYLYDRKTGEVLNAKPIRIVDPCIEREPFYLLWHIIYSITDHQECSRTLQKKFGIEKKIADNLAGIDFNKYGYGNKSVKVIRKILPFLMEGDGYSEAMSYAGYNHSNSLTRGENLSRKLLDRLKPVPKNSLRQPVVEKILNQMVNVVNAVMEKYGKPDEIRIELARELKQSKEERNETDKAMSKRQRENEEISKELSEYGLRATRNNIIKWRLYQEINNEDKRLNAMCIYCGQPISLTQAISGDDVDIEHIIPRSKLFDDSQSNKTLAHRHCNKDKGDRTAYDFMKSKSEQDLQSYIERVNTLYENKVIGKTKRDKLLMTENKIPDNFIDRQLRESQYISRKAREILQSVCHNVWVTSGSITAELRHLWGWDEITMRLQLPKYRKLGLTIKEELVNNDGRHTQIREIIKDWEKRYDHRHHAIDALTIACTKQGYIQRFNTLNASKTRDKMLSDIQGSDIEFKEKLSLLDKYIVSQKPLQVNEVSKSVANILISFKAGKKVAVYGKRKIGKRGNRKVVQSRIIVPRGALSEESVYGKIKTIEKRKLPHLFKNPSSIIKPQIKKLVVERLSQNGGDVKKALASLKKNPIFLNPDKKIKIEYASCFRDEYVMKYIVDVNFNKTDKVIDPAIKKILQNRLDKFGGKSKEAFRDVQYADGKLIKWYQDEGLPHPIRSVRCFTGLSAVVPVKRDMEGNEIGFVKPGNNHHVAIYTDSEGNKTEHVCTFWHAVERKKYDIPVIIKNSNQVWDKIMRNHEFTYPDNFLEKLPQPNLELVLSMQQNEMFVLGMSEEELTAAINENDYERISHNLYRVQKLAEKNYMMRHHTETQLVDDKNAKLSKRFILIQSVSTLLSLQPIKVKIDCLGIISIVHK